MSEALDCKFEWEFYGIAWLNKPLPRGRWRVYYTDWSGGMWEWPPTTAWYCLGRLAISPVVVADALCTAAFASLLIASVPVGLWTMFKAAFNWLF